jgi:hypothetical protein
LGGEAFPPVPVAAAAAPIDVLSDPGAGNGMDSSVVSPGAVSASAEVPVSAVSVDASKVVVLF